MWQTFFVVVTIAFVLIVSYSLIYYLLLSCFMAVDNKEWSIWKCAKTAMTRIKMSLDAALNPFPTIHMDLHSNARFVERWPNTVPVERYSAGTTESIKKIRKTRLFVCEECHKKDRQVIQCTMEKHPPVHMAYCSICGKKRWVASCPAYTKLRDKREQFKMLKDGGGNL